MVCAVLSVPPLPRRYLAIPAGRRPGAARTLQPGTAIAKEPADDSHLSGLPVPSQTGSRGHRRRAAAALPEPRGPPQRQATITAAATAETLRRGLRARGRRQQKAWRGAQHPGPAQAPPRAPVPPPPLAGPAARTGRGPERARVSRSRSVARGPSAQGGASAETRVAPQALQGHRAAGESAAALSVQSLRKGP